MTIKEKIQEDFKKFFKERKEEIFGTLRMVSAAIANAEIEKRGKGEKGEMTDEEVLAVLRKELKKRKEAAELYKNGGREELAQKEEGEAKVIEEYLPKNLSKEEIEKIAEEEIAKGGKNMGEIMKRIIEKAEGRAEGKMVAEIVKRKMGL
ncbi:MAG: GatB/YqeY domain-containing protein [Candidatus Paceibacterota bacterium]